jgi:protoporphyrinogen/coproporphyrinogen III oxidase
VAVAVAVIGAGISGLTAAWRLTDRPGASAEPVGPPGSGVVVLEGSPAVGGKLVTGELPVDGGEPVTFDLGAESTLARRPEAVDLIREAGLGADLVHPAVASASVLVRGQLRRMPSGTLMGVPNDPASLRDLLDGDELARALAEPELPAPALDHDVDVASWVSGRFGPAVADRLVEPLLGGVYAGHAAQLSLAATVPALWHLARAGGSVLGRLPVAAPAAPGDPAPQPVFAGIRGGVGRLPGAMVTGLEARGVQIRVNSTVRALERTPTGWRLEIGPASSPEFLEAAAVIIALPPPAAARLLARECPAAATELAAIEVASMAVIATLIPAAQVGTLTGSGLLVPPVEKHLIKAATFSSNKWAWVGEQADRSGSVLVRISVGRAGEEADLQHENDELARLAIADLGSVLGRQLSPSAVRVHRWGGGLPQYAVGHLDRVRRIRAAVAGAGPLAICGAALDGVGIPACIAAAGRAVDDLTSATAPARGTIGA